MTPRPPSEFRWLPSDAIIAHAYGITVDPDEMADLSFDIARCFCQFPHIDKNNRCIHCLKRFVFNPHSLPPPSDPTP